MREVAPDLGRAFADAFPLAMGNPPASPCPLRQAGEALIAFIQANPGKTNDLPYHNQHHFVEAVLAMGMLCAVARDLGLISAVEAALGVVAMVGHDIGHDGSAASGGALEALAAAETLRISRIAGVDADRLARIGYVIEGTDPAEVTGNEARSAGTLPPGRFGAATDMMRSLANEADVIASLMPNLGLRLGDALAAERRVAGEPGAARSASFSGRLAFLRLYAWFTPAAAQTGLPDLVRAQIGRLAEVAHSLGAGQHAGRWRRRTGPDGAERGPCALPRAMIALAGTMKRAGPGVRRFRISLTVTILVAFALVFVTVMGLTGLATYREAMQAAVASADRQIADLTARTAARTAALVDPLYATIAISPKLPDVTPGSGAAITATEASFRGLLEALPQARAVSAANADGALLQVLNLDAMPADRRRVLRVPDDARFAVRTVAAAVAGERAESWRFLDAAGHVREQREIGPAADPRDEIWFLTALNNDGIATTVLHMLPALGVPGLTIVRHMPEGGVLGIDVGLDSLGAFLAEQRISPRSSAFIIDDNGILLAHSDRATAMAPGSAGQGPTWISIASSADPIMHEVWMNYATGRLAPGRGVALDVGGEAYLARMAPLDHIGSPQALVAVVAPAADFTGPIHRARDRTVLLFLFGGAVGSA